MINKIIEALHDVYQFSVLLSLLQERKWLKCISTSVSSGCGRRGSTQSSWTMRICCDPTTLRAWGPNRQIPTTPTPTPVKHDIPPALMKKNRNWKSLPLVSESQLCIPTLHSRPWAMSLADGFRAEDRDARGHVPRTAFHVRVSKVKSLLGGIVEKWRLTVQCFLCRISISPRLALSCRVSCLWKKKKKSLMSNVRLFFELFFFSKMQLRHENKSY